MIDTWVQMRPPPLHTAREMTAGDVKRLTEPLTPFAEYLHWASLSRPDSDTLHIGTPEESKVMDDAFFDGRRKALLDEADSILRTQLNEGNLTLESIASARVALAYGRAQRLLWFTHVDRLPLPDSPWREQLRPHWKSVRDLLPSEDFGLPRSIPGERWLDDTIRLEFTLGHAMLNQGNVRTGINHLLEAICFCASAQQLGHAIVPARSCDGLDALYLLLDHAPPKSTDDDYLYSFHWFAHASLLIKDIGIGRNRRVRVPMTATPAPDGGLNLQFDDFYGSDEWWQGENALPTGYAMLDLTLTDRMLHARLYRGENTDYDRLEVNRLQQERRAGPWLNAEGSVLEPTVDVFDQRRAAVDSPRGGPQASYPSISWLTHYRVMRTY